MSSINVLDFINKLFGNTMSDNKLLEMINIYFDGELEKSREVTLFSLLANDQSARDYFKQLSVIRNAVDNSIEDLPPELEERILRSIGSKISARAGFFSHIKIFSAISYAAASNFTFLKQLSFL